MALLDVRTLMLAMVFNNLVLAGAMRIGIRFEQRNGANKWVAALVLQGVGLLVWGLRDSLPAAAAALFTASSISASLMFQLSAIFDFQHRGVNWRWFCVYPTAITLFATLNADAIALRVAVSSSMHSVVMVLIAAAASQSRGPGERLGHRIVAVGSLVGAALWGIRAVGGAMRPEIYSGMQDAGVVPAISTLVAQALTMMMSLGFLLMHRERQQHEMERLAMTDSLTGAFNRRTLLALGEKELTTNPNPVSVVILDLDFFKRINDSHGHLVGDEVLQRFAQIAQSCLRSTDVLTRYGGEEFCVLIPGGPLDLAKAVAERIRLAVEASDINVAGLEIKLTSSAGVAAREPGMTTTLRELLARADEALYEAKRTGRNRVNVWAAAA